MSCECFSFKCANHFFTEENNKCLHKKVAISRNSMHRIPYFKNKSTIIYDKWAANLLKNVYHVDITDRHYGPLPSILTLRKTVFSAAKTGLRFRLANLRERFERDDDDSRWDRRV